MRSDFKSIQATQQASIDSLQATVGSQQATVGSQQATIDSQQASIDSQQAKIDSQQAKIDSLQATVGSQQATVGLQQATIDSLQVSEHRLVVRSALMSEMMILARLVRATLADLENLGIRSFHDADVWIAKERSVAQRHPSTYSRPPLFVPLVSQRFAALTEANKIASADVRKRVRQIAHIHAHPAVAFHSDAELLGIASGKAFPARVIDTHSPTAREIVVTNADAAAVIRLFIHARGKIATGGVSVALPPAAPLPGRFE